ncbi:MAG TPA: type III secretion system outer membrane ring subunit SctC [Usitatibacter sp.]|nr:type III secretion system outer membrane ring subunit SctC [Usitatibacter sp.]
MTPLRRLRGLAGALLLFACLPVLAAATPWPAVPYSYQADNQPLPAVLAEFARHFGLRAQVTPDVEGMVNGRINAPTPTDFLARLSNMFGLSWFQYGGTLYVTRSTNLVTRSLALPATEPGTMRKALEDLGLFEPRFGWAELPERGSALVSGPPEYVELVAKVLAALPAVPSDQNVGVFRLKNASVDDRTIFLRDKQITTPGVATILRNLITGNVSQVGTQTMLLEMSAPLRAMPALGSPAAVGTPPAVEAVAAAAPPAPRGTTSGARRQAVIQSDPRQNAIIIRDTPERMPVYEKLIAFLDQPTALIEIEALIVDVNGTKVDELGLDWTAQSGNRSIGYGTPAIENDRNTIQVTRNVNPTTLVVDAGNFLIGKIRLLESRGDARLLSRPSILTVDNIGALIDLSQTFYIRVVGERVAQVVPVTANTTLRVTPRFVEKNGKRLVQLVVDIEDGSIQDRAVDQLPTVLRSSVSTEAVVGENQSLVIGGYQVDSDIAQDDAVPLLGRIPLVGMLFKHARKETQRRERLFMITPKIVAMPYEVAPASVVTVPGITAPHPLTPWMH